MKAKHLSLAQRALALRPLPANPATPPSLALRSTTYAALRCHVVLPLSVYVHVVLPPSPHSAIWTFNSPCKGPLWEAALASISAPLLQAQLFTLSHLSTFNFAVWRILCHCIYHSSQAFIYRFPYWTVISLRARIEDIIAEAQSMHIYKS